LDKAKAAALFTSMTFPSPRAFSKEVPIDLMMISSPERSLLKSSIDALASST